jgi:molybdate transport system ATP-binding protein
LDLWTCYVILDADFAVRRPEHTTRIALQAEAGEVVALVGPNGSGKTTALEAIAGLVPINDGHISIGGVVVNDATTVHVPSRLREVGYMFQGNLLFPHLSAADNVSFGPRSRGMAKRDARARALALLDSMGIADLAYRRPNALSGGQAQRVAIARALATDPKLLLLDEPMSALDATGAMRLRTQLREFLGHFAGATILVTHDAIDAMVLADRMAVLENGSVAQSGAPAEVAASPRTDHVAALVGINLVRGHAAGDTVTTDDGIVVVVSGRYAGEVFVSFRPSAVALYAERPVGSPRNCWESTVESIAPHGAAVRVALRAPFPILAEVTPGAMTQLGSQPGDRLWASVKATELSVYAANQMDT